MDGGCVSRYELRLPWTAPPLTMNARNHWRKQAAIVANIRKTVATLVNIRTFTAHPIPMYAPHVAVELHYWPRDRRRRDADNLVPVLKAACDGLVDASVVRDDTPDLMTKAMPLIHEPDGDPRLVLIVTTEDT